MTVECKEKQIGGRRQIGVKALLRSLGAKTQIAGAQRSAYGEKAGQRGRRFRVNDACDECDPVRQGKAEAVLQATFGKSLRAQAFKFRLLQP